MENTSPESARSQRSRLLRLLLLSGGGIGILFILGRTCGPGAEDPSGANTPRRGTQAAPNEAGSPGSIGFDDLTIGQEYKTSVASQGHRVSTLEQDVSGLRRDLDQLKADLAKSAEAQGAQIARLEEVARLVQGLSTQRLEVSSSFGAAKAESTEKGVRILNFEGSSGAPLAPKKALRIPTASAGEATVLNGVFAPTGGEPSPIRLRLDAAILGPSKSRVPLRDAILIGTAAGDANATRVTVELVSFSYVKQGGQSIEVPVRGYVVGEDGMEGIPGTYLYRLEDQVPLALVADGVAGFTSALAERETTRSVTPFGGATSVVTGDPLKYAGLKAAAGTSSKVGDILAERMRELRPAVWTPAEKRVKVVFLEGVTLEGFDPQEAGDGEEHPFRELDLHR
jgi:hypothetical protein